MTDQRPMSPEPCDHHWIHYGQPNHSPIRWIVKCSQCHQFDIAALQEEVRAIRAQVLHNANRDWRDHADTLENLPGKYYPGFWLKHRANQIERMNNA